MNRAATTLLITLALTAAAVAQTASPSASQTTTQIATQTAKANLAKIISAMPASNCPVGISAQPGVGPGMVFVVNSDTASQKLNLQLRNPSAAIGIKQAQITVHGLTAKGRILPASSNPDDNTIAKQVDLALTIAPGHHASTDMLFKGFTSISWITLDSLTYADGSTWHPAPHRSCSIVPNRFMAVADATTR